MITQWNHSVIPNFQVRPYQQQCYEAIVNHLRVEYKKALASPLYAPQPVVADLTVGAGKSLIAAMVAKHFTDAGLRVLVLARAGELVQQNFDEAWAIGCKSSAYSASLKSKSKRYPAIFATEGTIARAIVPDGDFGVSSKDQKPKWLPQLVIIDECHGVNYEDGDTQYMSIIKFFRNLDPKVMFVGLTGSPFRGAESIIGSFWSGFVGERITTEWAIEHGYLVPPQFGFPDDQEIEYDYSSVSVNPQTDDYTSTDLARIAKQQHKKLTPIMQEVIARCEDRHVVLIFASSRSHCKQISDHLPPDSWAIVTDSTPFAERQEIIKRARAYRKYATEPQLKYIINVGVMITGVNIPTIDCIVYLRAVGSLVVLIQSLGRGLRLCQEIEKLNCLVLDYTGSMARLASAHDNPILEEAQEQRAKSQGGTKLCPKCGSINGEFARRCRGHVSQEVSSDGRCEHFFSFITCKACEAQNDPMAKECRKCKAMLVDPNAALLNKAYTDSDWKRVERMDVQLSKAKDSVIVTYYLEGDEQAREILHPNGNQPWQRGKLHQFLMQHINCKVMRSRIAAIKVCGAFVQAKAAFDVPTHITHRVNEKGFSIINSKRFLSGREAKQEVENGDQQESTGT